MTSQQMFAWLNANVYANCVGDTQNPVCKAVAVAAAQSDPSLKTLATELYKIKEKDMVDYLQGPGAARAKAFYDTVLRYMQCQLSPSTKDQRKSTKDEINAITRIKNWYGQNYLQYLAKANIPGVTFSVKDAKHIQQNMDRVLCRDKDTYMTLVFWVMLVSVITLIVGYLLGHSRGKKCCLKHIATAVVASRQ